MDAISVPLAGTDTGKIAVPAERGHLGKGDPRLLALVVPSLAFGLFHFTYPAPWNTLGRALPLTLVWVPVSMLFLASRSLVGAVILNNLLALIGFVGNGIDLPGTAAAGWLRTALACALFVAVFFLTRRW